MQALILSAALAATVVSSPTTARPSDSPPRDVRHYNLKQGKPAIDGYDPVAYFPEAGGKPARGKAEFAHTHAGVTYWFASAENRDRFIADPDPYEPAYGGWCASALADGGRKVEIDPKNFKVAEGRLFLFYKDAFTDALKWWNKNEPGHTAAADEHWKRLTGESPRK